MTPRHSVALVADPHFHDIDHVAPTMASGHRSVRSLGDALSAARFINESYFSLRATLDAIVAAGLRLVVLDGDLTEDGQRADLDGLVPLLQRYQAEHGLSFFATFGNHDGYALSGRHRTKGYIAPGGGEFLLSSRGGMGLSDAAMFCASYEEHLERLDDFGFFRRPSHLHWESPFGRSDRLSDRRYRLTAADGSASAQMIDASYLVEPVEGLWLLAIDSNVYLPRPGAADATDETFFEDSKNGKWDSVVEHRPYLLRWMADVTARGRALGKSLVAFSHYPVASAPWLPRDGGSFVGGTLIGKTSPQTGASEAVAATGIGVHFSGHAHVCTVAVRGVGDAQLVDVALPALCGFPPAFRRLDVDGREMRLKTVMVAQVEGFDALFADYRAQAAAEPALAPMLHDILEARDFADFTSRHLAAAVRNALAAKHFGNRFAELAKTTSLGRCVERVLHPAGAAAFRQRTAWGGESLIESVADWYRLDRGGALALPHVPVTRLEAYAFLASRLDPAAELPNEWRDVNEFLCRLCAMATQPYATDFSLTAAPAERR